MWNTNWISKLVAVVCCMALVLTACGGDDGDDDASSTSDGLFSDDGGADDGASASDDGFGGGSAPGNSTYAEDEFGDGGSSDGGSSDGDAEGGFSDDGSSDGSGGDDAAADDSAGDGSFGDDGASTGDDGGSESAAATAGELSDAEGGLFTPAPDEPVDERLDDNTFTDHGFRDFVDADDDPLSTFALDVDTGSWTVLRRWLDEGTLPPSDAIRTEELVNAFDYDYRDPGSDGLDVTLGGGPSPFDEDNVLVRIGVQSTIIDDDERPEASLTFVVDTSGSMDRDDRLGLVRESLEILVDELDAGDRVAIVTYGDASAVLLHPTDVADRGTILDAIDSLRPGGSTNMEAGLRTGYALASEAFREGGVNRVILASDGVANVGMTDPNGLAQMIRDDADRGIQLVTVGFGMGNYNDTLMEQLADQGDGFYAYVDTEDEAERLFEDELTATLVTVALDAKIQVEFDADVVDEYRLLGFENRGVLDSDFRDDAIDAGEVGAGHQVTALYELDLRRGYEAGDDVELGEVRLRWEDPETGRITEISEDIELRDVADSWSDTDDSMRLATVVAVYAEILRGSPFVGDLDLDDVETEARRLARDLDDDQVDELADLIARTADLWGYR
ncbi:MAG: von Willebrand factor type A domain-containing protein [Acidimicrobiales bacterium]|nr:von Willebrand factor type A domain-containing protein [Acidimicrobiales bacterium]